MKPLLIYILTISLIPGRAEEDVSSAVKARLARFIFEKEQTNEPEKNVTVEWENLHLESPPSGRAASLHLPSPSLFYFSNANNIAQFHLQPNVKSKPLFLKPARKMHAEPELMEMTTWKEKIYVVSCYHGDYCQIFEWLDEKISNEIQSIQFTYQPKLLRFFVQEKKLHMIVVGEHSSIYKWMGSYFDEVEIWNTPGTRNFDFFSVNGALVMVFAQDYQDQGVSSVFLRQNGKTKLIQRLNCEDAQFVAHYQVHTSHGVQNYALILSNSTKSPVFWWNGKNFSPWLVLKTIGNPKNAYVENFQSEPFLFISSEGSVSMYHLKTTEVTLVRTVKIDGEIKSFTAEDPNLVFLIERRSGLREIAVVSLTIKAVPKIQEKNSVSNCFSSLLEKIQASDLLIRRAKERQPKILTTDQPAYLTKLTSSAVVTVQNATIANLEVNPKSAHLQVTPKELSKRVLDLQQRIRNLRKKLKEIESLKETITIDGDLFVSRLFADNINIKYLNRRQIDMDDILSVNKNQVIRKPLRLTSVKIGRLETALINQKPPNDILQKNLKEQFLTGDISLRKLFAANLRFGEGSRINGLQFDKIVRADGDLKISGLKSVPKIDAKIVNADVVNQVSARTWIQSLSSPLQSPSTNLSLRSLSVKKLTVDSINNLPWSRFLEQAQNQETPQDLNNLETETINGILVANFLTLNDDQNVTASLSIPSLTANDLQFKLLNNLTVPEVQKMYEKTQQSVVFTGPVQIQEQMNVSNVQFLSPVILKNSTFQIDLLNDMLSANSEVLRSPAKSSVFDKQKATKVTVTGDVKVMTGFEVETINEENVRSRFKNAVLLSGNKPLENARIQNLHVENITWTKPVVKITEELVHYNGKLHLQSLVIKSGNQTLPHLKIEGNLNGAINGVKLDEIVENVLSRTKDQVITGDYKLTTLNTNFLNASFINGIDFDDIMLSNFKQQQIIYSDMFFNNFGALGNVTVKSLRHCDWKKIAFRNLSEEDVIESLEVVGNISWSNSKNSLGYLSHTFENAVTTSGDHVISGTVTFGKNLTGNSLNCTKLINDVDLDFIKEDAILLSQENQTVTCHLAFKKTVVSDYVNIHGNLSVDFIDDVDVVKLNKLIVRKDDESVVTGLKTFSDGFIAFNLTATNVHGVAMDDLVFEEDYFDVDEPRVLPKTTFTSLNVLSNLTFTTINDLNFRNFCDNIVSHSEDIVFTKPVQLYGNQTIGSLHVEVLNDIVVDDVVKTDDTHRNINGIVRFNETFHADRVSVTYLGDENLEELYNLSIRNYENATVLGDLIVKNGLEVTGNLNIESVNDCNLIDVYSTLRNINTTVIEDDITKSAITKIDKIRALVKTKGNVLFKYLEKFSSIDLDLKSIKFTTSRQISDETAEVNIYGMSSGSCGLVDDGCSCPHQYVVSLESNGKANVSQHTNRTYFFTEPELKLELTVFTNTVSYSSRCRSSPNASEEITKISWKIAENQVNETIFKTGFLTDVKFFKLGRSIYITMAFFFNGNFTDKYSLTVTTFELDTSTGSLSEIDQIAARGVVAIDIVWAMPSYFLIIGNIRFEGGPAGSTKTEVYQFDEMMNKFQLLKLIRSHGVMGIKGVRIENQAFIFMVQKNPWPLLAFKYNQESGNFFFSEKLYQKSGFASVTSINLSPSDLYMGVVYSADFFTIFSYKQIEGLVEETTVKQKNVQNLQQITINGDHYLFAMSLSSPSVIYKIIV